MYKDDNITVCDNYSSVIVISFVLMMTRVHLARDVMSMWKNQATFIFLSDNINNKTIIGPSLLFLGNELLTICPK